MTDSFDAEWWRAHGPRIKARLTVGEKIAQSMPNAALNCADEAQQAMDEHGYPDWWSRVDRLRRDAELHRDWRWG